MSEEETYQYKKFDQTEHINNLAILTKRLAEKKLQIFEAHYDYQCFGSFMLVIGTSKKRLQFVYDGKENFLETQHSAFQNQNSQAEWSKAQEKNLESSNPFLEIEKQALELLK
ncbi:MAG: hypothetical protein ACXW4B_09170 [Micavibrio sp.]